MRVTRGLDVDNGLQEPLVCPCLGGQDEKAELNENYEVRCPHVAFPSQQPQGSKVPTEVCRNMY